MKNMKLSKNILLAVGVLAVLTLGVVAATDNEISACVTNDTGKLRMINFLEGMTKQCAPTETLLVWNKQGIQGPQGDKGDKGDTGDQGEPGLSAQHGAGNIAFIFSDLSMDGYYILKTDGTVWIASNNPPHTTQIQVGLALPVPVGDIVAWQLRTLVDKDGNYWFLPNNPSVWQNFGPLP